MAQRGRSAYLPGDGGFTLFSTSDIEGMFTAPQDLDPLPYPRAYLHTQWPGSGLVGDPNFDEFYASQVPSQTNVTELAKYNNASYAVLLDKIREAVIVITHSQSGAFGWQLADARPNLTRGVVAMESQGPPFNNWAGPPFRPGNSVSGGTRPYGLTQLPLHYDPPIGDDASLLARQIIAAANMNVSSCIRQQVPARKLFRLSEIPVLMLASEASYHTVYDHCTVEYLRQAGVGVKYVRLEDVGIYGIGHFMFMEKNNLEIAKQVVEPWLERLSCPNACSP